MPVESQAQNAAMHAAAEGKSTLGIPKRVGQEFTTASQGQSMSALPEHVQAQMGRKAAIRKAHRGRRSRGKGPKQLHAEGKTHLAAAQAAPTPGAALGHLFKAVRSFHAANQATTPTLTT